LEADQGIASRLTARLPSGAVLWGSGLSDNERRVLLMRNVTIFLNAFQHVLFLSAGQSSLVDYAKTVGTPGMALCSQMNSLKLP
jgi:hypothetical protein